MKKAQWTTLSLISIILVPAVASAQVSSVARLVWWPASEMAKAMHDLVVDNTDPYDVAFDVYVSIQNSLAFVFDTDGVAESYQGIHPLPNNKWGRKHAAVTNMLPSRIYCLSLDEDFRVEDDQDVYPTLNLSDYFCETSPAGDGGIDP